MVPQNFVAVEIANSGMTRDFVPLFVVLARAQNAPLISGMFSPRAVRCFPAGDMMIFMLKFWIGSFEIEADGNIGGSCSHWSTCDSSPILFFGY